MVPQDVFIDGQLNHLRNATDTFVLELSRSTYLDELRASIPATWNDSDGVIAIIVVVGRLIRRVLISEAILQR